MGPASAVAVTVPTADGLALHAERFAPPAAPRAAVVMVHGFSSYGGLYPHVAGALAAAGFAVTAYDARGHGRSPGRRGYVRRFSDFDEDLARVIEASRGTAPGRPLALVAHSQGVTVALDTVLSGHATFDLLVAAAPYLALKLPVPRWKLALSHVMNVVWPTLALDNELRPEDVSRNPAVWAGWDSDRLIHHVATSRWFHEVRAAQARVMAAAPTLRVPTFMPLPMGDRIVDPAAALAFAEATGGVVEVKQYEGLYHELFLEPERDQVIGDVVAWLVARCPSP